MPPDLLLHLHCFAPPPRFPFPRHFYLPHSSFSFRSGDGPLRRQPPRIRHRRHLISFSSNLEMTSSVEFSVSLPPHTSPFLAPPPRFAPMTDLSDTSLRGSAADASLRGSAADASLRGSTRTACTTSGEYLALTDARLNRKELVAARLATHFVPSEVNITQGLPTITLSAEDFLQIKIA